MHSARGIGDTWKVNGSIRATSSEKYRNPRWTSRGKRGFAAPRSGGQEDAACTGSHYAGMEVKQEIVGIDRRLPQRGFHDRGHLGKPGRTPDRDAVAIDVAAQVPVVQHLGIDIDDDGRRDRIVRC